MTKLFSGRNPFIARDDDDSDFDIDELVEKIEMLEVQMEDLKNRVITLESENAFLRNRLSISEGGVHGFKKEFRDFKANSSRIVGKKIKLSRRMR